MCFLKFKNLYSILQQSSNLLWVRSRRLCKYRQLGWQIRFCFIRRTQPEVCLLCTRQILTLRLNDRSIKIADPYGRPKTMTFSSWAIFTSPLAQNVSLWHLPSSLTVYNLFHFISQLNEYVCVDTVFQALRTLNYLQLFYLQTLSWTSAPPMWASQGRWCMSRAPSAFITPPPGFLWTWWLPCPLTCCMPSTSQWWVQLDDNMISLWFFSLPSVTADTGSQSMFYDAYRFPLKCKTFGNTLHLFCTSDKNSLDGKMYTSSFA